MQRSRVRGLGVAALLTLCACVTDQQVYAPPSCYVHAPLDYAPLQTRLFVRANYDLKDAQGFHSTAPDDFFYALAEVNPGKYVLADGVIPNLVLTITVTNDGYNHYGAMVYAEGNGEGCLFDYTWPQNYVTPRRLVDDVTLMIDRFITEGWNRNC